MTLGQLQTNLSGFNIRDEVNAVIDETREALKILNQGQLSLGKKSDGHYLPNYSTASVLHFGKPAGPIRLYDTGAFWNNIQIERQSGKIVFSDTDSKAPMLIQKYGRDILGLSSESKNEEYIPLYFSPALKDRIQRKTGLKCV